MMVEHLWSSGPCVVGLQLWDAATRLALLQVLRVLSVSNLCGAD